MRCPHCGEELDKNVLICPYCDYEITDEERDSDLLEDDEDDFVVGKTRSLSPIHDSELSLIDDINEEISKKEEKPTPKKRGTSLKEVNVGESKLATNDVNSVLGTRDSMRKRRTILLACIILTGIAVFLTIGVLSKNDKKESTRVNGEDYLEIYEQALDKYYETGDIEDVILILQANKSDEKRVENIQGKTRATCDSWLLSYISEKIDSKDKFEKETKKYEDFLYGLNHYAIATVNDKKYKALTDSDYVELSNQLSSVYEDGLVFFDALELYNKKDYNKAYSNFELVDNNNVYYENAVYYKKEIINNILTLLEKDLEKLKEGIDDLSIDDKIARYVAMEEIILKYEDAYVSVNLLQNDSYRSKLEECRNKIDEYSNMTTNEEN